MVPAGERPSTSHFWNVFAAGRSNAAPADKARGVFFGEIAVSEDFFFQKVTSNQNNNRSLSGAVTRMRNTLKVNQSIYPGAHGVLKCLVAHYEQIKAVMFFFPFV